MLINVLADRTRPGPDIHLHEDLSFVGWQVRPEGNRQSGRAGRQLLDPNPAVADTAVRYHPIHTCHLILRARRRDADLQQPTHGLHIHSDALMRCVS